MTRSTMRFVRGMVTGLMIGMAAGVAGCCYLKQHKRGFKRNMGRALRNMSDLVDNVNGMF